MENPSENEDESEGDDEPALLDHRPRESRPKPHELTFDDFENFSDFDKHLKSANKEESEDVMIQHQVAEESYEEKYQKGRVWCKVYLLPLPYCLRLS